MEIGQSFLSANRLEGDVSRLPIPDRSALVRPCCTGFLKEVYSRGVVLVAVADRTLAAVVDHVVASLVVVVDPCEAAMVVQTLVAVVVRVRTLDGQYVWVPLAQVVVPLAQVVVPLAQVVPQAHLPHLGSPH